LDKKIDNNLSSIFNKTIDPESYILNDLTKKTEYLNPLTMNQKAALIGKLNSGIVENEDKMAIGAILQQVYDDHKAGKGGGLAELDKELRNLTNIPLIMNNDGGGLANLFHGLQLHVIPTHELGLEIYKLGSADEKKQLEQLVFDIPKSLEPEIKSHSNLYLNLVKNTPSSLLNSENSVTMLNEMIKAYSFQNLDSDLNLALELQKKSEAGNKLSDEESSKYKVIAGKVKQEIDWMAKIENKNNSGENVSPEETEKFNFLLLKNTYAGCETKVSLEDVQALLVKINRKPGLLTKVLPGVLEQLGYNNGKPSQFSNFSALASSPGADKIISSLKK
jgi:hypothetical protein